MVVALHQAHAVSDTTVYVQTPSTVSVRRNFSVHILVSPHRPIGGMQCDLNFDPEVLQVVSVHHGGMFETWWDLQLAVDNTNGTVHDMVAFNLGGNVTSEEGTMATVVFRPRASGTSFLNLTNVVVSDGQGTAVSVALVNDSVTVTVDTTPPAVSLETGTPRHGDYITDTTPLTLTVADDSDFTLYYSLWNSTTGTWHHGTSTQNHSFYLHQEGTYTIEYYARDVYNNSSPVKNVTLYVDTTPPETGAVLDGAEGDNDWYVSQVTVALGASDAGAGVEAIYWRKGTTGDFVQYAAPLTCSEEGSTTFEYHAVDHLGNADAPETVTVKIDTVAPTTTVSLSGTKEGAVYVTPVTVSLSGSDAASGIASTRYRVNGGSWQTGTSTTVSSDGTYTVEYYSVDNAGNVEGTKSVSFQVVQNQPPTAAFGFSPQRPTVLDTVTFDASTSTDADGEIVNYTWNFGDDSAGYGKRPTHQYASTGNYTVTLTVTDDHGRQATATRNITVIQSLPDLVVTGLRHAVSVWGEDRVMVEVANRGDAPAEGFWCTLKVNGEPSARHYVESLGPGDHLEIHFSPRLSFFGHYVLQATADANQSVREKNEDNNDKTLDVRPVSWLLMAILATGIAAAVAFGWLVHRQRQKPEEPPQVRVEPEEDVIRCFVCLGKVKPVSDYTTCTCGATIHRSCARRVGECPQCGASLNT